MLTCVPRCCQGPADWDRLVGPWGAYISQMLCLLHAEKWENSLVRIARSLQKEAEGHAQESLEVVTVSGG